MKDIFTTICLAGAIQALFLSLVLIIKKNNRRANRFLALYLFFGALDALELYLSARGFISPARPWQFSIIPYSFVFGPSMYLYIALLTARINTPAGRHLLLYVPSVVILAVNVIFRIVFEPHPLPRAAVYTDMITNGGGLVCETVCYVMAFKMLHGYIGRLKDYFSSIDALKLSSIRAGLASIIILIPFLFIPYTRGHMRHEHEILDSIAILAGLGLLFVIAFIAILQPEIFNRVRVIEKAVTEKKETSGPKYEKLRLNPSQEERYVKQLRDYMENEMPYLDEELTLQDLADEMSLSTYHLSMILNIHFKQNFYNFINTYRVEEIKRKFNSPEHRDQTILAIAYSSGFNSKSTFNTMFKKFTGKTPKEYRTESSI